MRMLSPGDTDIAPSLRKTSEFAIRHITVSLLK